MSKPQKFRVGDQVCLNQNYISLRKGSEASVLAYRRYEDLDRQWLVSVRFKNGVVKSIYEKRLDLVDDESEMIFDV